MFLPINKQDMIDRGWDELDFLYISGEAYVDHPSFGHSIITRLLEKEGFKVGIISEPNWKSINDFNRMGKPKIAVLISSGVIDSMVNNYTVSKKKRNIDEYSPGGVGGLRPDRAVIVYCNKIREIFGNIPIIIGGIEASLRRFSHYDYWDDSVRKSILLDSSADLLVYGMGEKPFWELSALLKKGVPINKIKSLRGTCYISNFEDLPQDIKECMINCKNTRTIKILNSHEDVLSSKEAYAKSFKIQYENQDAISGSILIQKYGNKYVVQNLPQLPMTQKEMDKVYNLKYERTYHPIYEEAGGVPSIKEVEFSITSQRGCFGACNFCAITFHQGRTIQNRSEQSILTEAEKLTYLPNFKGYIHDVGGPTANFRIQSCDKQKERGMCIGKDCLYPEKCKNLKVDHTEYINLLRKVRKISGVKKVFIRSGIRYDYVMYDKSDSFFKELCEHHVSGQLKVAPEHVDDTVLDMMGKPHHNIYEDFKKKYFEINNKLDKEQYLVPYFISSHPGSTLKSAIKLAEYLRDLGYMPEQVQDFYPTPGTVSTCMFYTGIDPRNMKPVYIPKSKEEKDMQRALLQYRKKENYNLVLKALKIAKREDLIGFTKNCLIKPTKEMAIRKQKKVANNKNKKFMH